MSDKTVPADADDYKHDHEADGTTQDNDVDNEDLVEAAKSQPGEIPNRDEDEFTGEGLEAPDVETQVEDEVEESDNGTA